MEPPRMTAREWDDEQDPIVLLDILYPMRGLDSTEQQTRASRMYLLACGRRAWERLPMVSRVILEMAEPIAERETVEEAVRDAVRQLAENLTHCRGEEDELRELERRLKLIDWPQDRRARETRHQDAAASHEIGRIDDTGWDGMELIHQLRQIFSIQGYKTEILAASIRYPNHIIKCAEAGADIVTCPLDSILGLLKHPLTDNGLAKFLEDAKKFA